MASVRSGRLPHLFDAFAVLFKPLQGLHLVSTQNRLSPQLFDRIRDGVRSPACPHSPHPTIAIR